MPEYAPVKELACPDVDLDSLLTFTTSLADALPEEKPASPPPPARPAALTAIEANRVEEKKKEMNVPSGRKRKFADMDEAENVDPFYAGVDDTEYSYEEIPSYGAHYARVEYKLLGGYHYQKDRRAGRTPKKPVRGNGTWPGLASEA